LHASSLAFQEDIGKDSAFSRSVIDREAVDVWAEQDGVEEAAPFGNALINGKTDRDVDIDLALFGIEVDSFLNPSVDEGAGLSGAEGEIVISATAAEEGVEVGDIITVEQSGIELRVVGVLADQH